MEPIYLDHAATTVPRPEVVEAMLPYLTERFGNPSSMHRWGREARAALEDARERLATVLGAARNEVVFTGSGTEADNLALLGRWRSAAAGADGAGRPAVAYAAVEHKAVVAAAKAAGRAGARVIELPVDGDGVVDLEAVDAALAARPAVLSVQWGNNEVGTVQPVREVADRCRAAGVAFHTDAVQALGRVPVRVDEVPCDLLALSAHKFGGPRGMGALYIRTGVAISPVLHGGGQERALRPGTQDVAGAVGMATAAERAAAEQAVEAARLTALRDELEASLLRELPDASVIAGGAVRLPHISNISFPDVDQETLLVALDLEGVAVSSGSACLSGTVEPSHVLTAMGRAGGGEASIRFSLGRTTTADEVREAVRRVAAVAGRVRETAGW